MAWNPHPKVADCRDIARKWGYSQVIILATSPGKPIEMATFGETKELCEKTRILGEWAMSAAQHELDFQANCPD